MKTKRVKIECVHGTYLYEAEHWVERTGWFGRDKSRWESVYYDWSSGIGADGYFPRIYKTYDEALTALGLPVNYKSIAKDEEYIYP